MARKNIIGISEAPSEEAQEPIIRNDRPIAGFVPSARAVAPVGGITKTLGNITGKIERAEALERQLAEGQSIIELDPQLIDSSFISDRLAINPTELGQLVEQMREHGQQVPILVRPHPEHKGRYQVAYGHRRLVAARQLGRKVKAAVRELTDDQLVVSQGQENNTRADLSYIERALFAAKLEDRGFSRETVMSALGVDKTTLSRMISVARQIPLQLIVAIGAAPAHGRRRWIDLAEFLNKHGNVGDLTNHMASDEMRPLTSDERFRALFDILTKSNESKATRWQSVQDAPAVKFKRTGTVSTFVIDHKSAPGFDEFVKRKLSDLYTEYRETTGD